MRGHRLDLVQDVARDDHALAGAGPVANQADGPAAGERIHSRERLIEDEQRRIVHDCLRQLDPLAHPLAVGADLLVRGIHQLDRRHRPAGRLVRFFLAEAVEPDQRGDPFEAGHPLVEGVLLRAEPIWKYRCGLRQIGSPSTFTSPLLGFS